MNQFYEIKLVGKYVVSGEIELLSGLHIGTSKDTMKIGDLDNPVIKDASGKPYIPGSSLKGKMRALMEFYHDLIKRDSLIYSKKDANQPIRIHMCGKLDCPVCGLFGRAPSQQELINGQKIEIQNKIPTRIIVGDAYIDEESVKNMKENLDYDYTEVKFENTLDRILSTANPRQTERVPRGAKFSFEIIINRFIVNEIDDDIRFLKELLIAMKLLEDDYLGGQGTRGYGKIAFRNISIEYRDIHYYSNESKDIKCLKIGDLKDIFQQQGIISSKLEELK